MLVKSENVNSSAVTDGRALVARDPVGPEVPRAFTPSDEAELRRLQDRHGIATRLEGNAVRRRALLLRDQHRFLEKYGVASINAYAESLGFKHLAATLVLHLAAQLFLNINMQESAEDERDALQHEVSQLARALATLAARRGEHDHLNEDAFVAWYKVQGRISGLAKAYREANRAAKADGRKADSAPAKTPDEQVAEMFDNPAALEIDAVAGIASGQEGVLIFRHEGDKLRLIPLTANKATIIGLAGYAPCPLTAVPADLRFYRAMLLAGAAFVPDEMSDIPIEDVPEGDVANDSYDMLPAYGMYLVERDRFSIAHARRDDGLILEIIPSVDLGYTMKGECFIDNFTRRRLSERLVGEADAAQFGLNPVEGVAAPVTIAGQTKTVTFTSKADGKPVNLIIKPRQMGTVWTYRASSAFAPIASATMSPEAVTAFDGSFMKVLLRQQKDRAVTVTVGSKGISLANGKAAAALFEAKTQGAAKVQVMLDDLRRAMVGLLALPMTAGLTWRLDPNGLLLIEAATEVATYRVFVQTLEPSREQPTRSRALRERVRSLPKSDAPAAAAV